MATYFVLGSDNQQYGPVTCDVLKQWFSEGRLVAETQLREDGSETWKPARDFPEIAAFVAPKVALAPLSASAPSASTASETRPADDMDSLLARDYEVKIGEW